MSSTPIFSLRVPDVYQSLETSPDGLSAAEAESRLSLYGGNLLSEMPKTPLWQSLLAHFMTMPAPILLLAGLLLIVTNLDIYLGLFILGIIVLNTGLSFYREYRAEQALEKLRQVLPSYAHAIREGENLHIPASEIVPGDVLVLAEGYNIPADARVVEEYGLRTNNATLTGESVPARKIADASLLTGISELERPNLIFAGTSVASGTGKAVVYATGMLTQFGRIANLTRSIEPEPTALQREMNRLSKIITWTAAGIGAVVLAVGLTQFQDQINMPVSQVVLLALGIVVAGIPEGLLATLTLSLAMAVQRLAQKGVLAKSPSIVEALGNISVICTDKSGTLTQNQMTVREAWVDRRRLKISGVGYEPVGKFYPFPAETVIQDDLFALLQAATLCNNARLHPPSPEQPYWTCLGDQTEAALKVAACKLDIYEDDLNREYPRLHEIPFDARRKRMSTVHRDVDREVAFVKGAPREVLALCNQILLNGQETPLDDSLRAEILAANDDYARNALRVLALARTSLPPRSGMYTTEKVEKDLTFLGLMAMMDPPRPEVEQAIQTCRQAQIRIVMITGDYGLTAESLARRIGMLSTPDPLILTGSELDAISDVELERLLDREVIFARMAPEHKLRLVAAFQARGDVVAVTGDGVNDAPALRKSDVGISMGIVGTDVSKEAADVILTNDNFGAIVYAIQEGRAVYDNIRKFITYIFSSNVPELMPFIVTALVPGMPLALTVRQILAIDMGTDILPALALGSEKPEPDVMTRPPRRRDQRLIGQPLLARSFLWLGMIEAVICFAGFLSVYLFSGNANLLPIPWLARLPYPSIFAFTIPANQVESLATTVYHAGVVLAQVGNVFACRSRKVRGTQLGWFSNGYIWLGVIIEILGILAMIYIEPVATVLGHAEIPACYWYGLALFPFVIYGLEWFRKLLVRWLEGLREASPKRTDSNLPVTSAKKI